MCLSRDWNLEKSLNAFDLHTIEDIPSVDQLTPFQKHKKEFEPSDDLQKLLATKTVVQSFPYLPAANILLALPAFTSMAVTGPGTSEPEANVVQVELTRSNWATLAKLPSPAVRDPPTMRYSWLF